MDHAVEPMDIDSSVCDFDNKENSFHHSNVLPRTPCTEKGYEELDVSELNMKLRYSVTPASSPMSKSFTANCIDNRNYAVGENANVSNENSNLTRSLNSTIKPDSPAKTQKVLPLQALPTDLTDSSRNAIRLLDSTVAGSNVTITVSGMNNIDDNMFPSTSSSMAHTPEATTPTTDIPISKDGNSPIMRGLKSVFNMFRPSQSPIPLANNEHNDLQQEVCSPPIVISPESTAEYRAQTALSSTPLMPHKTKDVLSKRSSPNRDSIIFNEDLEKDLLWKEETTIIFSHEKIPIHKLLLQQSKPVPFEIKQTENSCDFVIGTKKEVRVDKLDATVEYMDISLNDSATNYRMVTDIQSNRGELFPVESDSEFVDCESTFTKDESLTNDLNVNLSSVNDHISETSEGTSCNASKVSDMLEVTIDTTKRTNISDSEALPEVKNRVNILEGESNKVPSTLLQENEMFEKNSAEVTVDTTKGTINNTDSEPLQAVRNGVNIPEGESNNVPYTLIQKKKIIEDNSADVNLETTHPEQAKEDIESIKTNTVNNNCLKLDQSLIVTNSTQSDLDMVQNYVNITNFTNIDNISPILNNVGVNSISQIPLICDPRVLLFNIPLVPGNKIHEQKDVMEVALDASPVDIPLPDDDDVEKIETSTVTNHLAKIFDNNLLFDEISADTNDLIKETDQKFVEYTHDATFAYDEVKEINASDKIQGELLVSNHPLQMMASKSVAGMQDSDLARHIIAENIESGKVHEDSFVSSGLIRNDAKNTDLKILCQDAITSNYVTAAEIAKKHDNLNIVSQETLDQRTLGDMEWTKDVHSINIDQNINHSNENKFLDIIQSNDLQIINQIETENVSATYLPGNLIGTDIDTSVTVTQEIDPSPSEVNLTINMDTTREIDVLTLPVTAVVVSHKTNVVISDKANSTENIETSVFITDKVKAENDINMNKSEGVTEQVYEDALLSSVLIGNDAKITNFKILCQDVIMANNVTTVENNAETPIAKKQDNLKIISQEILDQQTLGDMEWTKDVSSIDIDQNINNSNENNFLDTIESNDLQIMNHTETENVSANYLPGNLIGTDIDMSVTIAQEIDTSPSEVNLTVNIDIDVLTLPVTGVVISDNSTENIETTDFITDKVKVENEINMHKSEVVTEQASEFMQSDQSLTVNELPFVDDAKENILSEPEKNKIIAVSSSVCQITDIPSVNDSKENQTTTVTEASLTSDTEDITEIKDPLKEEQPIDIKQSECTESTEEKIETVDEEVVASESNSPFVSVTVESEPTAETKSLLLLEEIEKLTQKSSMAISPPGSPKIVSKGYNFNFDEIENPFATKTNIRMSPPPEVSPNEEMVKKCFDKTELSKKHMNRRKSQPARKIPTGENKKMNSTFSGTSNIDMTMQPPAIVEKVNVNNELNIEAKNSFFEGIAMVTVENQCADKYDENVIDKSFKEVLNVTTEITKLNRLTITNDLQKYAEILVDEEIRSNIESEGLPSKENAQTSSSEQSTYFSVGTSSNESIDPKNAFNLPEIDDLNFNPFVTKSKMRQSPPPSLDIVRATDELHVINCLDSTEITQTTTINPVDKLESGIEENDSSGNITDSTCTSNATDDDKDITVREVNTEDEDTVEGPFLEAEDLNDDRMNKFDSDMMEFTDLSPQETENMETGELFIDAEAFEFLFNQNQCNAGVDNGKESLFLKFDPLFAKRLSSDSVATLNKVQKRQSTPKKVIKTPRKGINRSPIIELPILNDVDSHRSPIIIESSTIYEVDTNTFPIIEPPLVHEVSTNIIVSPTLQEVEVNKSPFVEPSASVDTNITPIIKPTTLYEVDKHDIAEDSIDDVNVTVSKPMMVVNPAVNPIPAPRNKSMTPTRSNRHSLTFTSPAITLIDRLLSMSANNSLIGYDTAIPEVSREQNGADVALTQLRELLADKEINVYNLRSESRDLKERLTNLESQMRTLESISEERLKKINELNEKLSEKTNLNKSMAAVFEEYERMIARLIDETEQDKKHHAAERVQLIKERDEQTTHLASMEVSFSDLHSKYEKSKQVLLGFKANEESYKKSLTEFEENISKMKANYELLKQHATSKLNHANEELQKINRAHEAEVLKLNAKIKRKELHITSLEETLTQKTKANEELTAICDELINKVG